MNDKPVITIDLLNRLKSSKGGYTRASLEVLGVGWPPKRGWRKALIRQAQENEARRQATIAAGGAQPEPTRPQGIGSHPDVIRGRLLLMSQAEREAFFHALIFLYCLECGRMIQEGEICHCTRDD